MRAHLPPEILFLIVKNVERDEKEPLRNLTLVSQTFYQLVAPLLYHTVTFGHIQTSGTRFIAMIRGFCQAMLKDAGKLAHGVRVLSLKCLSTYSTMVPQCLDNITAILPLLTHLDRFELDFQKHWVSSGRFFSTLRSSQLTTFIWTAGFSDDDNGLVRFLTAHPSIEHLEVPYFRFHSPPPDNILPRLRKLVVQNDAFLSSGVLQMVSHLSLFSTSTKTIADDTKFERTYSTVEYFSAMDDFSPGMAVEFSSRLPNVRCLFVMNLEMECSLSDYLEALGSSRFRSKRLEYILLCSKNNDPEDVEEIFDAMPTVRVIDIIHSASEDDVYTRYYVDRTPILLPLDTLPSRWPTEEELERILE
ncbi:hypothetical protein ONZ45_g11079 [Pleurotus djamor]|nr:hypothetical protein ONZ45_g11079 [Pleurotus djamor]